MTENEVNIKCREWLLSQGYAYKGVLNTGNDKAKSTDVGFGQIPVPDGLGDPDSRNVLIDHMGHKDYPTVDLIWVEAKGSGCGMSDLLQGFSRVAYAVYHGGGRGLLACPAAEFGMMLAQKGFLRAIGTASARSLGLLDAEKSEVYWL